MVIRNRVSQRLPQRIDVDLGSSCRHEAEEVHDDIWAQDVVSLDIKDIKPEEHVRQDEELDHRPHFIEPDTPEEEAARQGPLPMFVTTCRLRDIF